MLRDGLVDSVEILDVLILDEFCSRIETAIGHDRIKHLSRPAFIAVNEWLDDDTLGDQSNLAGRDQLKPCRGSVIS
jgi:hypothetical protein